MEQELNIFCINLKSRPDRWKLINQEFRKARIKIKRINAYESKIFPWYGCTCSHKIIIQRAIRDNLDNIVVFEDDIEIYNPKEIKKQISLLLRNAPKDWHIIYLWWLAWRDLRVKKTTTEKLYKVEGLSCTYGLIYNKKSYPFLLAELTRVSWKNYKNTFIKKYKAIDDYLAKDYQKKHPCYVTWPFLVGERDNNYSNIEKVTKNTGSRYKRKMLLHILGLGIFIRIMGKLGDKLKISARYKKTIILKKEKKFYKNR